MPTQATLVHTREDATSPIKKKFRESSTTIHSGWSETSLKWTTDWFRQNCHCRYQICYRWCADAPDSRSETWNWKYQLSSHHCTDREIEQVGKSVSLLQSRYDTVQTAVRKDRDQISDLKSKFDDITLKIADMEDRSRSNVRLVDLREGAEGDDCIAFLKANLPKWIPSIMNREIKSNTHIASTQTSHLNAHARLYSNCWITPIDKPFSKGRGPHTQSSSSANPFISSWITVHTPLRKGRLSLRCGRKWIH